MSLLKDYSETWYVQDGLVLHLDGIYNDSYINQTHTDNPTIWKDLSGNNYNFAMTNITTTQDSFIFDGTAYGINDFDRSTSNLDKCLLGLSDKTIEVVFKMNTTSTSQVMFLGYNGDNNNISRSSNGLWYRPTSKGFKVSGVNGTISPPSTVDPVPTDRMVASVVCGANSGDDYTLYINNGVGCPKGAAGGNMQNYPNISIGAKYSTSGITYALNGEICAIRVYNRKLTDKERAHNFSIDKRRFDIKESEES
jgi:hypothetical protein